MRNVPPSLDIITSRCRDHAADAIECLATIMHGEDVVAAVGAATVLLNYAYGQPAQRIEFDATGINIELDDGRPAWRARQ
jgi:hypothetical protein